MEKAFSYLAELNYEFMVIFTSDSTNFFPFEKYGKKYIGETKIYEKPA